MWDEENNDTSIIKPCPFCGGEAEPDRTCNEDLEYCLQCKECDACIYRGDTIECKKSGDEHKTEVIRAWNRRTNI